MASGDAIGEKYRSPDQPVDEIEQARAAFQARPIQRRLIEAAGTIAPETVGKFSTLHTVFCQTYLPARAQTGRTWERRNGDVTLQIEAGSAFDAITRAFVPLPLPFGAKARLALIALVSEALRSKSPVIEPGRSMTAFVNDLLGRSPNGRDVRQVRQQLAALIVATLRMGWVDKGTPVQVNTSIADLIEGMDPASWADEAGRRGKWPWPNSIRLSDRFFESLAGHAVPLDPRALAALAHKPLGLDIYCWLAQRLHRIPLRDPAFVTWFSLGEQFSGFARLRSFREHFMGSLAAVRAVYPAAKVEDEETCRGMPTGLRLYHSPPPILKTMVTVDIPGGQS